MRRSATFPVASSWDCSGPHFPPAGWRRTLLEFSLGNRDTYAWGSRLLSASIEVTVTNVHSLLCAALLPNTWGVDVRSPLTVVFRGIRIEEVGSSAVCRCARLIGDVATTVVFEDSGTTSLFCYAAVEILHLVCEFGRLNRIVFRISEPNSWSLSEASRVWRTTMYAKEWQLLPAVALPRTVRRLNVEILGRPCGVENFLELVRGHPWLEVRIKVDEVILPWLAGPFRGVAGQIRAVESPAGDRVVDMLGLQ
ncbi:hypothetical protein DFJ74DRAFT_772075 [Hyaloraphidium curvatum]|nr:hypothetical protein DFJ74DRAFT_772075 [Hyaloraphidium curvatum]